MVVEGFQINTRRVCQSTTAARYTKPRGHWDVGDVHGPDLIGTCNRQLAQQVGVVQV